MRIRLPDLDVPMVLRFDRQMTEDEYFDFCSANADLKLERLADGTIVLSPPGGAEASYRNTIAGGSLSEWAKRDGQGKTFGSSAEFILPNGAAYMADASWVSNEVLSRLTKEQKRKFLPIAPEFLIEVMAHNDRLIDGDARTVHVYRHGAPPEIKKGIRKIAGEGPVKGFVLDLTDIWAGL